MPAGVKRSAGMAWLVGAGPGDLKLLTLRAREVLERADVVVYDFLANARLLELAPPRARKVYVGKQSGRHTLSQAEINALLVRQVARGKRVVRLKGGDPYLFGRGGEEGRALHEAGLPFEVIPGIASALAVPAYAGIPVTERNRSASLAIVTGHEHTGKDTSGVDFSGLARMGTVVFLMGMKRLRENLGRLAAAGAPGDRPAAAIQWGTRPQQRTVTGTVATLADEVERAGLGSPAIVIVGDVVGLRPQLDWFEQRPWFGRRIVTTRPRESEVDLLDELEHNGAHVVSVPTIAIAEPEDYASLDRGIRRIGRYDGLVFTSGNGVEHFFSRLRHHGKDARALAGLRVACVGPATAAALERQGVTADVVPTRHRSAALADAFGRWLRGKALLLVRAEEGSEDFPEEARRRGARVDLAVAYRTVGARRPRALELIGPDGSAPDLILFASGSAVRGFAGMLRRDEKRALRGAPCACIGPVTAAAAREHGFVPAVVPATSTLPALVAAMEAYFAGKENEVSDGIG